MCGLRRSGTTTSLEHHRPPPVQTGEFTVPRDGDPIASNILRESTWDIDRNLCYRLGFVPLSQRPHPASDGSPDLVRRIFLNEMYPGDGDLGLRWPCADGIEIRSTTEERTGLGLYEQLGHITRRQPFSIGRHDGIHVGRLALDRDFPRPRQCRPSPFAGLCEGPPVLRNFL